MSQTTQLISQSHVKQQDQEQRSVVVGDLNNNFYSTYNFNIMHSQTTEFVDDQFSNNRGRFNQKQLGTFHRGGGSEFRDFNIQKTLLQTNFQKQSELKASRYRSIGRTPIYDLGENSILSGSCNQDFEVRKYQSVIQNESSPTDFNFKRKTKNSRSRDYNLNSVGAIQQRESVLTKSYMPLASTEDSYMFGQTTTQQMQITSAKTEPRRQLSQTQLDFTPQTQIALPTKVSTKCKSLLQKKFSEQRPAKIRLQQQLIQNKTKKTSQQSSQIQLLLSREEKLKNRPVSQRPSSALQRTQIIVSRLAKQGIDTEQYQKDNQEEEDVDLSTMQTSQVLDSQNQLDDKQIGNFKLTESRFSKSLSKARLPRLTQLTLKNETQNFQIQLANLQFQHIQNRCSDQQELELIKDAYQYFTEVVARQILQNKQLKEINSCSKDTISQSSSDCGSQIGEIMGKNLTEDQLQKKIMKSLQRGLVKYRRGLQAKVDSINYQQLTQELNFQELAIRQQESERARNKRLPMSGDDLPLMALSEICGYKKKVDQRQQERKQSLIAYTLLLEQRQPDEQFNFQNMVVKKQPKLIPKINQIGKPGSEYNGRIKRGFLLFPHSLDIEKADLDEEIDDPELIFDHYLQRLDQQKTTVGLDFVNKFEDQRISGIYNFNSTIYEKNPTARVAYFTNCKKHLELALPILAKVKNQELILNDYRLESGHFAAIATSFQIQPNLINKISLNNSGLDDMLCAELFRALKKLNKLESIQITKAELGQFAVAELIQFLHNTGGWGLQTLILKDLKIQSTSTELLFKTMISRCYLKTFSLVNFNFSERNFGLFTEYFKTNPCLQNLDISFSSGIRPQGYMKFMEVLSRNKQLHSLDISWNSLIEDQPAAFRELQNPYKVFKAMYEKWIKMGPGARWPGKPDPKATGGPPKVQRKQVNQSSKGGRVMVQVPDFDLVDKTQEIPDRIDQDQINLTSYNQDLVDTEIEITRIVKQCLLYAFQRKMIKKPTLQKDREKVEEIQQQQQYRPKEEISTQAMVVTEAIYKFIRRNQKLQHLNISRCNLSQVMLGRIGLGIKCSKTVMAVHFSENPGVTPALKAFLQLKMKAVPPLKPNSKINNLTFEQDQNLNDLLAEQLKTNNAQFSLANETILLREQKKKTFDQSLPSDPSMAQSKTLVFTRLLGHKLQIPNSGRWQIITDPSQECWICSKHIVSLIFWNSHKIAQSQVPETMIKKSQVVSKLQTNSEVGNPFIYGEFTNWAPVKMKSVKEFAELTKKHKTPNFMSFIVKKFNLGPGYDSVMDLKPEHKKYYQQLQYDYDQEFDINWRRQIASMLKFQETQMVNYEYLESQLSLQKQSPSSDSFDDFASRKIFVHAALIKPGKHHYVVQYNQEFDILPSIDSRSHKSFDSSLDSLPLLVDQPVTEKNLTQNNYYGVPKSQPGKFVDLSKLNRLDQNHIVMDHGPKEVYTEFYLHRNIIPLRSEPIPLMQKMIVEQVAIRQFIHRLSVFAPWKPDNAQTLNRCAETDWLAMNLGKYLKNDDERESLMRVVKKHMAYLKELHLDLISESDIPPFVSFLDFVNFSHNCNLVDESLKQASLELIFVQVDTNNKFRNGIIRGEFIEALIRIAKAKYLDTGVEKKMDTALDLLIETYLKPNWATDRWQKLRNKRFWNNEVNDILQANLEGLQKVHRKFWDLKRLPKKKYMELKECEQLAQETNLKINLKSVKRAYILSKMTCSDEQTKLDSYNKLQFVEFLEFMCRLALDLEDDNIGKSTIEHLQKRLELVLDHILSYVDLQRKDVVIETLMDSDADLSDCDY